MNRYLISFFLILAIFISGFINVPALLADNAGDNSKIDTPEKAAEFASKLANEKCQMSFGRAPFTPGSYSAELIGSRWCWGKIEPPGIRGYSAEVKFNTYGTEQNIRAVLHTDKLHNQPNYKDSKREITIQNEAVEQIITEEIFIDKTPSQDENTDNDINEKP